MLPLAPETALVLDELNGWEEGLRSAGVTVGATGRPDLVVADAAHVAAAVASGAPTVLLEGRGAARALAGSFPHVERYLSIPSLAAPHLILPLGHRAAADYAVRNWSLGVSLVRRARNQAARWLLARGALPELRPHVTVGSRIGLVPFLVQAAGSLDVPDGCEWFMTLGSADALTRGVFHLFPPAANDPSWILKFARIPGYADPFDRDERGLAIARSGGEAVARHAPRLLGRLEVAGLAATVETAAVGSRLTHVLQGSCSRADKLRAIDAVAGWTIDVGLATATPPDRLAVERRRIAEEVLPAWRDFHVPGDLVERVALVSATLQHNDLGSWNIVSGPGESFTAVDWESARAEGLPLWDLVYFLADALLHVDGASAVERRDAHTAGLFRGELPSSQMLFQWIRRAVEAQSIPERSVGPLVTLCWLHHGLSGERRRTAMDRHAPDQTGSGLPEGERIARLWLTAPGLGVSWDAWRF